VNLSEALLIETTLVDAILNNCSIYGISAWGVKLRAGTIQRGLVITGGGAPAITVDDLEVAQFIHLMLHNNKLRRIIEIRPIESCLDPRPLFDPGAEAGPRDATGRSQAKLCAGGL
jgi:hypothetical protein